MKGVKMFQKLRNKVKYLVHRWAADQTAFRKPSNNTLTYEDTSKVWMLKGNIYKTQ